MQSVPSGVGLQCGSSGICLSENSRQGPGRVFLSAPNCTIHLNSNMNKQNEDNKKHNISMEHMRRRRTSCGHQKQNTHDGLHVNVWQRGRVGVCPMTICTQSYVLVHSERRNVCPKPSVHQIQEPFRAMGCPVLTHHDIKVTGRRDATHVWVAVRSVDHGCHGKGG